MGLLYERGAQYVGAVRSALTGFSGYAVVGLACFWQVFRHGFWDMVLADSPEVLGGAAYSYPCVAVLAALLGIAVLFAIRSDKTADRSIASVFVAIVALCFAASVFCLLFLAWGEGPLGSALALGRLVCLAASMAVLTIGWGIASASRFSGKVVAEFALSYFLGFILMVPEFLPFPYDRFVAIASPGVCGLMLVLHLRRCGITRSNVSRNGVSRMAPLLAIFVVVSAFTKGFLNTGTSVSADGLFLTTCISLVFSFFIIVIVACSERGARFAYVTWMVFVILYLLGIFIIVATGDTGTHFGKACMLFTGSSFWFLLFAVFATEGGDREVMVASRFVGLLVLVAVSACIAYILVPCMRGFAQEQNVAVLDTVFLTTAFIFVAVSFAFLSRILLEEKPDKSPLIADNACDRIAAEFGLTAREKDVLKLVPTGYTYKKIGAVLFISQNTVLSHMKSIYRKTGADGKQELLDLIEKTLTRI